jgi:hypothetical protein
MVERLNNVVTVDEVERLLAAGRIEFLKQMLDRVATGTVLFDSNAWTLANEQVDKNSPATTS